MRQSRVKADPSSCRAAFDPSMVDHNGSYMTDCEVDEKSCRDHAKAEVSSAIDQRYRRFDDD